MPEDPRDWPESEHRDELHDPSNPPNSLLSRETRSRVLMSYVAPIVILFVVVGVALIYWANRPAAPAVDDQREENAIGTVGTQAPGSLDPGPDFDRTEDEVRFRGGDTEQARIGGDAETAMDVEAVSSTEAGRRVRLQDVEVDTVDGTMIWVRQDDRRLAVMAPGEPAVGTGDRVDVHGTTETGDQGAIRIRAHRIDPRD